VEVAEVAKMPEGGTAAVSHSVSVLAPRLPIDGMLHL